ncbi:MAG: peptidylprolyl isomerase, partial [Draconibacterium sp.]
MKKSIFYLLAIGIFIAGTSCSQKGIKSVKLENNVDSVSYAIGILVGEQNAQQLENAPSGDELNKDILISAFSAALKKDETKMTLDDAQGIIRTFFETASKKEAQKNLEEGNAFLEENKKRDSVITTESGLQYEIITEGTGKKPSADDRVKVNYEGKLI